MAKKLSSVFYNATRRTGKIASKLNDIETLLTFNPKKIAKRAVKKNTRKSANNIINDFLRKF